MDLGLTSKLLDAGNVLSLFLLATVAFSTLAGAARGASGSAKRLAAVIGDGAVTVAAAAVAWMISRPLSPLIGSWLKGWFPAQPDWVSTRVWQSVELALAAIRDYSLFRFLLLFLCIFPFVKWVAQWLWFWISDILFPFGARQSRGGAFSPASGIVGAGIGFCLGVVRAVMIVAVIFVLAALAPGQPLIKYAENSYYYRLVTEEVVMPLAGDFVKRRLPQFTQALEKEYRGILARRYEVIDREIPDDVALAAKKIVAGKKTDEAKARALYEWVGTRIRYDDEKVRLYEEYHEWREQTPEETFKTRKGVCIDYSRLYAVMARAVGLKARVVTGIGHDGNGGSGPHAWNEVLLASRWVPLDTTWANSGGNWFDPPNFAATHVREA
ncbi:MAG TPA: transglutaminase-like domain-containing protein [Bacilli bacterium]